jgi:acetylornithine deacetylase/succinyl-diaminopimelate desuccinylase-like protein
MTTSFDPTALGDAARTHFATEGLPELGRYTSIACLSPAFDPDWKSRGAIDAAAALLESWSRAQSIPGAIVEIVEIDGRTPVLFADIPASEGSTSASTTLVYGHFDKQPPLGTWREGLDPYTAVHLGDHLYGRGTADDGYSTFAAFAALHALAATGTPHGRVVVLIESSEESGSPDLAAYLDRLGGRIGAPNLVLCLDSGGATYDRLWVTSSLRGNIVCTVRVDVLDEGVHSGGAGGIVPSSFRLLRQLIGRLEDASTGELLLPELHGDVPGHRREEIAAVAAEFPSAAGVFPTVPGLTLAGDDGTERIIRGTWGPALAFTGIDGVPAVRDGGNVLRPFTTGKLSIRLPPTCDSARAMAAVDAALTSDPPDGARVTLEWEAAADGWDAPSPAPWLAEAVESASIAYFSNPPRSLGLGGSIPFLAELGRRYPGTQFLATGVLGPESNAHGPNEFLHVPMAERVAAVVAYVIASAP